MVLILLVVFGIVGMIMTYRQIKQEADYNKSRLMRMDEINVRLAELKEFKEKEKEFAYDTTE